jgi:hypothetical protein
MQAEDIRRWQRRQPFQPFRLCLTDGRAYEVRHPELIFVSKRWVSVGLTDGPAEPDAVPEHVAEIDVLHVVRLEPVVTSSSPTANGP